MGKEDDSNIFTEPPHIVREITYDQQLEKIAGNFKRLDELDEAIEWGLSHGPTNFFNIEGEFYLWKMEKISEHFPQLRIIYRYSVAENTVYLIAVDEI